MVKRPAFLGLLAATLTGIAGRRSAGAQAERRLRVGTMPADFGGQAYYAKELGMFAKAGFTDAEVTSLNSGNAIAAAALAASLDVGYSNVLSLAIAHDKGIPLMILAGANVYDAREPTVGLIAVLRGSPIKTAADLTGKTIATGALKNITEIGARNWIDATGGDSNKVKFVEIPNPAIAAALLAGRADAGIMNQGDYPTLGKPDDPIRVIANAFSSIAPRFISGAWFSTADWIAKNPADARAFVTIMNDAATWANSHHAESAVILGRYLKESSTAIEASARVAFASNVNTALLQPSIDVAAKYGVIKSAFPARDFISNLAV
jgi:NitT/TauT family transport system substrate-binding protein